MKQRCRMLALGLALGFMAAAPLAAADKGFTVTPGLTHTWFDSNSNLEDAPGLRLGLGYRWSDHWSVEAVLGGNNTEYENGADVDLRWASLDWMYHFRPGEPTQPYLIAGLGHEILDPDGGSDHEGTSLALGAGLTHALNERWFLRADLRRLHETDSERNDTQLMLGVGFRFGGSTVAEAPAAPPTQPNEPVVVDSDSDGVPDEADRCPGTPAGDSVDARGCELDSDDDGVVDRLDACPDTPRDARVDERGCALTLEETVSINLDVNFALDSAEVIDGYQEEIAELARFMREYPNTRTTIEGHTDSQGAAEYNQGLSQRRADAVRRILIDEYGVAADRLVARGYGETRPVADNATPGGRLENRRVEARVEATETRTVPR